MTTLIICRGLPACGKSTRAREWVGESPGRRAEVNRDHLRLMAHGGYADAERQITAMRDSSISALLRMGIDVVSSDTNLPQRSARELAKLARAAGATVEVWDMTNVSRETCVERDAVRDQTKRVGRDVIAGMHARYLAGKPYPLPLPDDGPTIRPTNLYVPKSGTPDAIMVDIDGTVALMNGRSPYDETRVSEDLPNEPVIAAVRAMFLAAASEVIFCSGRTEASRADTEAWLRKHVNVPYVALHMRATGDVRKDSIVKMEIFDKYIRDSYDVVCVFDDRDQVVKAWRSIGLTVMQVAPGDF